MQETQEPSNEEKSETQFEIVNNQIRIELQDAVKVGPEMITYVIVKKPKWGEIRNLNFQALQDKNLDEMTKLVQNCTGLHDPVLDALEIADMMKLCEAAGFFFKSTLEKVILKKQ